MAQTRVHRMTPARRTALKKAQLASARKRRRRRVAKGVGIGVGVVGAAGVLGAGYGGHKAHQAYKRDIASGTRYNVRTQHLPYRHYRNSPPTFHPGVKIVGHLHQVPYGHKGEKPKAPSGSRHYTKTQSLSVQSRRNMVEITRKPKSHIDVFGQKTSSRVRVLGTVDRPRTPYKKRHINTSRISQHNLSQVVNWQNPKVHGKAVARVSAKRLIDYSSGPHKGKTSGRSRREGTGGRY